MYRLTVTLLFLVALAPRPVSAQEAAVAVASNFLAPMEKLAASFGAATGDRVTVSSGATGKLYAQIVAGAPYDLFFAADAERPARLETEGLLVAGSRFPYALGRLAMISADAKGATGPASLAGGGKIALANPAVAPYGRAAVQFMEKQGPPAFRERLVKGENVSQVLHFVATGAAPVGFVALSQIAGDGAKVGSSWVVPDDLYDPIRQEAGLLKRGEGNRVATAFLAFVKSGAGRAVIASSGYRLP